MFLAEKGHQKKKIGKTKPEMSRVRQSTQKIINIVFSPYRARVDGAGGLMRRVWGASTIAFIMLWVLNPQRKEVVCESRVDV
jgi:hypothetical protein